MVYQQKLVAVIKCNGKILREQDNNTVYLPFLAEYEIFIKNLESRDCVIDISIDGQNVLDNHSIVIKANSSASLEGFLKGNKVTNKFRFIQKTKKIQDNRQDQIDDGMIRIEYRYVKQHETITTTHIHEHHYHHNSLWWYHPPWCKCSLCRPYFDPQPMIPRPYDTYYTSDSIKLGSTKNSLSAEKTIAGNPLGTRGMSSGNITASLNENVQVNACFSNVVNEQAFMPNVDEGITVKGSESNQQFQDTYISPLEDISNVIVINLRGYKGKETVERPILVKTKLKCPTCGRKNKSQHKFCAECGTALF